VREIGKSNIMNDNRILPILLLILACIAVYANSLNGDFVYDDVTLTVLENPFLNGLVGWREVLTWDRPVREFTYWLDHKIWGNRPFGYHLQNLFWHVLSVFLMWRILRELGVEPWQACLAPLLFAIHPVNTEAVAWISGRKDLLCLFFELCAVWSFLRFLRAGVWCHAYAVVAILSLFLALFSKQVAVVLPLQIGMIACVLGGRHTLSRKRVAALLGVLLVVTLVLSVGSLRMVETAQEALQRGTYYDPSARHAELTHPFLTGWAVWGSAVRLLLFPHPLTIERTMAPVSSWGDPRWMAGFVVFLAALALLWRFRRHPVRTIGLAWILVAWLPTSGIIPATYLLADRYMYIPCVGFCLFLSDWLLQWLYRLEDLPRKAAAIAVSLLLAGFTFATVDRNWDWNDEISLWSSAARFEPANPKVRFNLGNACSDRDFRDQAEKEWKAALDLKPDYAEVHINLGGLYHERGDPDTAESHYREALKIVPDYGIALYNLAALYKERGNLEEAIQWMSRAVEHIGGKRDAAQKAAMAWRDLAQLLLESGRYEEARKAAQESLKYNPNDRQARVLLSEIQSRLTAPNPTQP